MTYESFIMRASKYEPGWKQNIHAQGEDRTHDLQIALFMDYETDALPTAPPRQWRHANYSVGQAYVFGRNDNVNFP